MKPLLRIGVKLPTMRDVAEGKPIEALPRQPVTLAPPKQGMPPCAANLTAEPFQPHEITWNRVIVEIALHHTVQPLTNIGNTFMPPAHQSDPNSRQCCPHTLLRGKANDLEPTLTVCSTAVRESKKVERLRMTCPPVSTVCRSKSTKRD